MLLTAVRVRPGSGCWGSGLAEGAVRPVTVVMVLERVQHGCSVPLIDDQKTVEEFAADRADESLGDRVGSRRLYRCFDDPDVHVGEDGVEGGGELGVAVADEELESPSFVLKV